MPIKRRIKPTIGTNISIEPIPAKVLLDSNVIFLSRELKGVLTANKNFCIQINGYGLNPQIFKA
jgi:hypothetical protein